MQKSRKRVQHSPHPVVKVEALLARYKKTPCEGSQLKCRLKYKLASYLELLGIGLTAHDGHMPVDLENLIEGTHCGDA